MSLCISRCLSVSWRDRIQNISGPVSVHRKYNVKQPHTDKISAKLCIPQSPWPFSSLTSFYWLLCPHIHTFIEYKLIYQIYKGYYWRLLVYDEPDPEIWGEGESTAAREKDG